MGEGTWLNVEDLVVYGRLCLLHLEVCELSHGWPPEERYELGSQVRRSSNSAPAQLAEKNDDRERYKECVRMLNGLERTLEQKLPPADCRWTVAEPPVDYGGEGGSRSSGWPVLTPET